MRAPGGHWKLKTRSDGSPCVEQGRWGQVEVSFNPDDERFYVTAPDRDGDDETLATFAGNQKGFENAKQFAKRKHREYV